MLSIIRLFSSSFILTLYYMKSLCRNILQSFTNPPKIKPLTAYKYIRSVSETALLYKPLHTRNLQTNEHLADRVVQAFFDSSKVHIRVAQAEKRLTDVKQFSTPAHSFYQICLPFEENHTMRLKMVQFSHNYVRVGRMLELMDYIAANVAYRYCTPDDEKDINMNELPFLIATAAIDSIEFYYPISVEIDCTLSGYVSYVGRSSMEVHIDVLQKTGDSERLACSANFVMVARNKATGKAYEVPTINFNDEKDTFRIIHELGFQRQASRKKESSKALEFSPPTYEESVVIHKLKNFLKTNGANYVPMASTILKNTTLMHLQDKNLSGKVFGGLIMRLGYELGWLCASKFLKSGFPIITHVDDVQFLAPVELGTYVQLEAKVGYVTDRYIHIIISCTNSQINGKSVLTNILRVTFEHGVESGEITKVAPETLDESYSYIESMRRVEKMTPADI